MKEKRVKRDKDAEINRDKSILVCIPVHAASQAFKKGNSIHHCAARHCGARWLIKVDVADFFESISEIQVCRVFKQLGYQPLVAFELARLCTIRTASLSPRRFYKQWRVHNPNSEIADYSVETLGYVPQGAPTSPLLSNLVMRECDTEIATIASKYKLTYTRYSDDLTLSTRSKDFDRKKAREVVNEIYKALSKSGLMPQDRKTNIAPPGSKKIVLGLNVDREVPRLQKEYRDRIRQHLHYLQKFGPSSHTAKRGFDSIWGMKSHLKGMIDYANMIEPEYAEVCMRKFEAIDWSV